MEDEKMTFEEFFTSRRFAEMYIRTMEAGKNSTQHKYEQLNAFAEKGKTVFIGDSIMEYFPVHELLGDGIYDRGVGGDTSSEMLARLSRIALPLEPSKVFILVGTNDIQAQLPLADTVANVKEAIRLIQKAGPSAGIYLLSAIPVNEKAQGEAATGVGLRTNKTIKALNASYKALCSETGATFVDIYSLLAVDDNLPDEYSDDGLHPTVAGYLPICDAIRKYL